MTGQSMPRCFVVYDRRTRIRTATAGDGLLHFLTLLFGTQIYRIVFFFLSYFSILCPPPHLRFSGRRPPVRIWLVIFAEDPQSVLLPLGQKEAQPLGVVLVRVRLDMAYMCMAGRSSEIGEGDGSIN